MKGKIVVAVGIVLCVVGTVLAAGAGNDPGTSADPVVTKSYVDGKIDEVKGLTGSTFEVIKVEAGKVLIGEGGTELIVRSGESYANSYFENGIENGLQDITDGIDIKNRESVKNNHLIIIPRTDTRGITTTTECYIMIKGKYTLQ